MNAELSEGYRVRVLRVFRSRWFLLGLIAAVVSVTAVLHWREVVVRWHQWRAVRLLQVRENRAALAELRAALRLAFDDSETHRLLAWTHRRLGNLDRIVVLLRRAEGLGGDPVKIQRESWLAIAQAGRLREAEPHLAEQLTDPRGNAPDICEALVLGYYANLRITEAFRLLDTWQKDFPEDPQPNFMRGFLLQPLDRKLEAIEAYRQGLALAPRNTLERHRYAQVLAELGQLDEAETQFRRCVKEDAQNADYLAGWAYCLSLQGEAERAQQILENVVATAPNHFEALRQLSDMEFSQNRFDAALQHLQAAARQKPYDKPTRYQLAQALRALGRRDEAKPHLDYVAKAEKADSQIARYERQVMARPDDPQVRYEMAMTLLDFGRPELGVKWLDTVLELQPEHRGAHRALADYYEAQGDGQNARRHRQRSGGK